MNWYTHYIGDYLRDTMHLSWLEDLAYRRLLETYYATEKPIPTSVQQVFNICRTRSKEQEAAVTDVLRMFFIKTEKGYSHEKVEEILAKSKYVQQKRAKAGSWDRGKKVTSVEQVSNKLATVSLPLPLDKSKAKARCKKHPNSGPTDHGDCYGCYVELVQSRSTQ